MVEVSECSSIRFSVEREMLLPVTSFNTCFSLSSFVRIDDV